MKIAITGSNGFLGSSIKLRLKRAGHFVKSIYRSSEFSCDHQHSSAIIQNNLYDSGYLRSALEDVDILIHVGGLVHQGSPNGAPFPGYYRSNSLSTQQLANACRELCVNHLIFISSIAVNGTISHVPVSQSSPCIPSSNYAISKYLAEHALIDALSSSSVYWTILRPPLIYGPGAPGSFSRVVNFANKYQFLPFGSFHFTRSMIHVDNMSSIVERCCVHDKLRNRIFTVSDGDDFTISEFSRSIIDGLGLSPHCSIPFPAPLFSTCLSLLGRRSSYANLFGDLVVDSSDFNSLAGWSSPLPSLELVSKSAARTVCL